MEAASDSSEHEPATADEKLFYDRFHEFCELNQLSPPPSPRSMGVVFKVDTEEDATLPKLKTHASSPKGSRDEDFGGPGARAMDTVSSKSKRRSMRASSFSIQGEKRSSGSKSKHRSLKKQLKLEKASKARTLEKLKLFFVASEERHHQLLGALAERSDDQIDWMKSQVQKERRKSEHSQQQMELLHSELTHTRSERRSLKRLNEHLVNVRDINNATPSIEMDRFAPTHLQRLSNNTLYSLRHDLQQALSACGQEEQQRWNCFTCGVSLVPTKEEERVRDMSAMVPVITYPCGHMRLCRTCSDRASVCPLPGCQAKVESRVLLPGPQTKSLPNTAVGVGVAREVAAASNQIFSFDNIKLTPSLATPGDTHTPTTTPVAVAEAGKKTQSNKPGKAGLSITLHDTDKLSIRRKSVTNKPQQRHSAYVTRGPPLLSASRRRVKSMIPEASPRYTSELANVPM